MRLAISLTIAITLLCAVSLTSRAADTATQPGGTWTWTYDYGQGPVKSLLTLSAKGNKLTGDFHGESGKVAIEEGTFDGSQVSFQIDINHDGQPITVKFSGSPKWDSLTGTVTAQVNGEDHEFPWNAKRATRAEDVLGVWKLTINADNGQTYRPAVRIEQKEKKLMGRYETQEIGDHDLESVALDGNVLRFRLALSQDGRSMTLDYQGTPRGDQIAGSIDYDFDGTTGTVAFSGERATSDN